MSVANSQYDRIAGDKYFTPEWATTALLTVERFTKVWDPAGGDGGIVNALPVFIDSWASDIAPDAPAVVERDFFDCTDANGFDIITNPPYGPGSRLAVKFIEHALKLTQGHGGKVAMLLKVGFDSAPGRVRLFRDHPAFAAEHRVIKRIAWSNLPAKYDAKGNLIGPTEHHSWMIWDWRHRGVGAVKGYLPLREAANV